MFIIIIYSVLIMTFFKAQIVMVRTVNGVEKARAIERTATGIFCTINRKHYFVPNANIVEWL